MVRSPVNPDRVRLRDIEEVDLPLFFDHQCDPVSTRMAAFTSRDRDGFMAHWQRILADDDIFGKTVVLDDRAVGFVLCFRRGGRRLVGYWLARDVWGRGVATRALSRFLSDIAIRPLHAFVSKRNLGSIRVLEKCGFVASGESVLDSAEHGAVEEWIMTLDEAPAAG